ncbi:MAG: zinc metallopeptidase [Nitrosomonas sp.]|nr:zinc metallopeptidase [Nitrosomonas sp.]MBK7365935.1 zinc metallopeptidase [Nitrosomonas sp.]
MLYLLLIIFIIALIVGPAYWVKHIMERYSQPDNRYTHTGAEFARRLLNQENLSHVKVELTELGDHYDPINKVVRLTSDKFNNASLTAITVAAHEVGHAMQDRDDYLALKIRTKLVALVVPAQKFGAAILMLAPVSVMLIRSPLIGGLMLVGGFLSLGSTALVHIITLPMELNASFSRALPLLKKSKYLKEGDELHAHKLLTAAAWTYVSASLMTLLNIARWWAILRR